MLNAAGLLLPWPLLGALRGKGALVVTANDYLARRDADSVGLVFRFLGLSVGLVEATMAPASEDRREAYACDVTYVSNAEIGFDLSLIHISEPTRPY